MQQEIPVCTHLRRKCNKKFLFAHTLGENATGNSCIHITQTLEESATRNSCMHTPLEKVQQEMSVCTHLRSKCNKKFLYAHTLGESATGNSCLHTPWEKMQQEIHVYTHLGRMCNKKFLYAHTLGASATRNSCMHTPKEKVQQQNSCLLTPKEKVQHEIPVCTHLRSTCNKKYLYAHTLGESATRNSCLHTP